MSKVQAWHVRTRVTRGQLGIEGNEEFAAKWTKSQEKKNRYKGWLVRNPKTYSMSELIEADGPQRKRLILQYSLDGRFKDARLVFDRLYDESLFSDEDEEKIAFYSILKHMADYPVELKSQLLETYRRYQELFGLDGRAVGSMLKSTVLKGLHDKPEEREPYFQDMKLLEAPEQTIAMGIYVRKIVKKLQDYDFALEVAPKFKGWSPLTVNYVLDNCIKNEHVHEGLRIYDALRAAGGTGNDETFSLLVRAYSKLKQYKVVERLMDLCKRKKIPLDDRALHAAAINMEESANMVWAEYALEELTQRTRVVGSHKLFRASLRTYLDMGKHQAVIDIFEDWIQAKQKEKPGRLEYSMYIAALHAVGRHEKAVATNYSIRLRQRPPLPEKANQILRRSIDNMDNEELFFTEDEDR
ncbi:hypothetical protein NDN08_001686 [Rhodosorus marinus]|uniref:Pentacotripeptide-repeat region of PRORP domain-containing protein n=1 Tax=Rhodosorus marinus TaxID=101924 RepID=A0AAV8UV90_9RHOD|nr:hypothetical protein NDN08_001686 [Rhodosorus marinus]